MAGRIISLYSFTIYKEEKEGIFNIIHTRLMSMNTFAIHSSTMKMEFKFPYNENF